MPYSPNGISGDGGVSAGAIAALGGFLIVFILIYIALMVVYFWSYGTLLKAALNQPKVMVLLMLIPIANLVMPIVWGVQAHNLLKEKEAAGGGGGS